MISPRDSGNNDLDTAGGGCLGLVAYVYRSEVRAARTLAVVGVVYKLYTSASAGYLSGSRVRSLS